MGKTALYKGFFYNRKGELVKIRNIYATHTRIARKKAQQIKKKKAYSGRTDVMSMRNI